jgi:hypothetical protein
VAGVAQEPAALQCIVFATQMKSNIHLAAARLTNAFSKKLENHIVAISLHYAHYNFCRVHQTLRVAPAMAAGLTDHVWTIPELLSIAG